MKLGAAAAGSRPRRNSLLAMSSFAKAALVAVCDDNDAKMVAALVQAYEALAAAKPWLPRRLHSELRRSLLAVENKDMQGARELGSPCSCCGRTVIYACLCGNCGKQRFCCTKCLTHHWDKTPQVKRECEELRKKGEKADEE